MANFDWNEVIQIPSVKILSVEFSTKTTTENISDPSEGSYKRITNICIHIMFEYIGFNNTKEYGTAVSDVLQLCTVTFDSNGNALSISIVDTSTIVFKEAMINSVETAILAAKKSIELIAQERSVVKSHLGDLNRSYSLDDRTKTGSSYQELDDFNTGIGSNRTNILEL